MRALRICTLALLLGCASSAATEPADVSAAPTSGMDSRITEVGGGRSGQIVEIEYTDATGATRAIRAELRLPDESSEGPLPVVVWSHGGSRGFRTTDRVGDRWGKAMNDAGFAFVAIAHAGRTEPERTSVCRVIGGSDCEMFNALFWDRPHDVAVVLDWVESIARDRRLDAGRVVYGGHSAGALGVMLTAGMEFPYASERTPPADPRPVGFIAASPPGADTRSIGADHLASLTRPMLFLTGLGDETSSTPSSDRRATTALMPADLPAALLWIDRREARHGLFNLNATPCERAGGSTPACRSAARMIAAVGVGFVRDVVAAPSDFDIDEFVASRTDRLPAAASLTTTD